MTRRNATKTDRDPLHAKVDAEALKAAGDAVVAELKSLLVPSDRALRSLRRVEIDRLAHLAVAAFVGRRAELAPTAPGFDFHLRDDGADDLNDPLPEWMQ